MQTLSVSSIFEAMAFVTCVDPVLGATERMYTISTKILKGYTCLNRRIHQK